MVGGSGRSDGGSAAISSSNIFAALEGRRKSKKKDKAAKDAGVPETKEEPAQFWTAPPVTVASWADCEDDDDDYFATVPPPMTAVSTKAADDKVADNSHQDAEESEDDDDLGEDGDDNEDAENEAEEEEANAASSRTSGRGQETEPALERGTERQLSKKELKKKELAELDAVLAELGLGGGGAATSEAKPEANGTCVHSVADLAADGKGLEAERGLSESKSAKAKKRKLKKEKEKGAGPGEEAVDGAVPEVGAKGAAKEEAGGAESAPAEESTEGTANGGVAVDAKERLKKLAAGRKSKSSGKSDTAVAQAAAEAKARAERLAAAKKKDSKNHYNQQPVR